MLLLHSSALVLSPWWLLLPVCALALIAWNERIPLRAVCRVLVAVLVAGVGSAVLSGTIPNVLIDCGRRWFLPECW